jgi:hypothetical protein
MKRLHLLSPNYDVLMVLNQKRFLHIGGNTAVLVLKNNEILKQWAATEE